MPSSGCKKCALDRKSTRLNSSHTIMSYAGFCLKKKEVGGRGTGSDGARLGGCGSGARVEGRVGVVGGVVAGGGGWGLGRWGSGGGGFFEMVRRPRSQTVLLSVVALS